MNDLEFLVLKSMAKQYPTIAAASTEIINLQSYEPSQGNGAFLNSIHGEWERSSCIEEWIRNSRAKLTEEFGNTNQQQGIKRVWQH